MHCLHYVGRLCRGKVGEKGKRKDMQVDSKTGLEAKLYGCVFGVEAGGRKTGGGEKNHEVWGVSGRERDVKKGCGEKFICEEWAG